MLSFKKKNNKVEGENISTIISPAWSLCKYNEVGFGCSFHEGDACVVFPVTHGRHKDGFLVG